jgi:hypothetical protein
MGDAIVVKGDVNETMRITIVMSVNGKTVVFRTRVFMPMALGVANDIDSQGEINARRMSLALSNDGKRVAIGLQD